MPHYFKYLKFETLTNSYEYENEEQTVKYQIFVELDFMDFRLWPYSVEFNYMDFSHCL